MIDDHGARAGIGEFDLAAAAVLAQLQHGAQIFVRHEDGRLDPGLFDERQCARDRACRPDCAVPSSCRRSCGCDRSRDGAVAIRSRLNSRSSRSRTISRCSRPKKAAAETEAQRGGAFRLIGEARIVQMQLARAPRADPRTAPHRPGKRPQNTTCCAGLKPGSGVGRAALFVGDGVAHLGVGDLLDLRGDETRLRRAPAHRQSPASA